ncbi:MAG: ester cyclase [SAR202 cluster bacterium]|nr:ester cyclase [SAR202 cluster bacterium]
MPSSKSVVQSYWGAVFGQGRGEAASQFVDEIFVDHTSPTGNRGPDTMLDAFRWLRSALPDLHDAFPDLHTTFDAIAADGDLVTVRTSERGTHRGVFRGKAPTGRQFRVAAVHLFRVRECHSSEGTVGRSPGVGPPAVDASTRTGPAKGTRALGRISRTR